MTTVVGFVVGTVLIGYVLFGTTAGAGFTFTSITGGDTGEIGITVVFGVGVGFGTVPFYFQSMFVCWVDGPAPALRARIKKYRPVNRPASNSRPNRAKQHLLPFFLP